MPMHLSSARGSDALTGGGAAANLRPAMQKRVFLQNFGCQMNDYDGARMLELLRKEGYSPVDAPENADLVVLNTCSVREKAEAKVASAAGRLRKWKIARPDAVLAVSGCVA